MRTIPVHLDARLLFHFAVCVASDVVPAVDDNNLQAQLGGCLFCDCQAKKARPDNDEVSGHKISWFEYGQPNGVHWLQVKPTRDGAPGFRAGPFPGERVPRFPHRPTAHEHPVLSTNIVGEQQTREPKERTQ